MIISSLLDTDYYKFTMGQVAFSKFPTIDVEYNFKCRNKADWSKDHVDRINYELNKFCQLSFRQFEIDYLRNLNVFSESYLDFLKLFKPSESYLKYCGINSDSKELDIVVKGPWHQTIYWEVPLLAIVNEVYFIGRGSAGMHLDGVDRLNAKTKLLKQYPGLKFADFGTRRRYSGWWQRDVVNALKELPNFVGTSNVALAEQLDVSPIGTMAHEFFQVGQALDNVSIDGFQKYMLQVWMDQYRGKLATALTDIVGFDAFLRDFDLYFAKLYDGLRHDSGDPFIWADKAIGHFRKLGLDPKTKTLVFSDGLDVSKAIKIYEMYKDTTNTIFGIGTNFTNDFRDITPLQIVMKIVQCNGKPVAKISDSPGKGMCRDVEYERYLRKVFNIKES